MFNFLGGILSILGVIIIGKGAIEVLNKQHWESSDYIIVGAVLMLLTRALFVIGGLNGEDRKEKSAMPKS